MTTHQQYVLASDNPGKLREMMAMFSPLGIAVRPQSDWQVPPGVEETGSTFVENALIKARHAASHTGLPAIADDSGLVVPALQGEPGICSARYAGPDANAAANMDKLLAALDGINGADRVAYFFCAMVCLESAADPAPLMATGRWHGRILAKRQGEGGFGYDPIFGVGHATESERQLSAAEMSAEEKGKVSHRGQALRKLAELVRREYDGINA
ncbi:MAG: RdgB/HAM1 family non-canonical purine NTP pyrophosphatase [Xanthomonadales bacterium]|nr:RdgB/HAM1 family non-canonical purine NTP pyrophosphatase [Xanthomonadales bacterium]